MIKKVTFCLTSCNRFDLLQITLNSFFAINTYPIEKFIIIEDSGIVEMKEKILSVYGDRVELIFNEINLGPYKSIDKMYQQVDTEYIFHSEDDWRFDTNPNLVKDSIDILEERRDVNQIWVRNDIDRSWIETTVHNTNTNVPYQMVKNNHLGGWCGFSHNPGLRRKDDYLRMFPEGYAAFIAKDKPAVYTEHRCNTHAMNQGYRAASLVNTSCVHIGGGRTTI